MVGVSIACGLAFFAVLTAILCLRLRAEAAARDLPGPQDEEEDVVPSAPAGLARTKGTRQGHRLNSEQVFFNKKTNAFVRAADHPLMFSAVATSSSNLYPTTAPGPSRPGPVSRSGAATGVASRSAEQRTKKGTEDEALQLAGDQQIKRESATTASSSNHENVVPVPQFIMTSPTHPSSSARKDIGTPPRPRGCSPNVLQARIEADIRRHENASRNGEKQSEHPNSPRGATLTTPFPARNALGGATSPVGNGGAVVGGANTTKATSVVLSSRYDMKSHVLVLQESATPANEVSTSQQMQMNPQPHITADFAVAHQLKSVRVQHDHNLHPEQQLRPTEAQLQHLEQGSAIALENGRIVLDLDYLSVPGQSDYPSYYAPDGVEVSQFIDTASRNFEFTFSARTTDESPHESCSRAAASGVEDKDHLSARGQESNRSRRAFSLPSAHDEQQHKLDLFPGTFSAAAATCGTSLPPIVEADDQEVGPSMRTTQEELRGPRRRSSPASSSTTADHLHQFFLLPQPSCGSDASVSPFILEATGSEVVDALAAEDGEVEAVQEEASNGAGTEKRTVEDAQL
ncbi:unnamed protein product [Amoebophrya sp. A120]|nr:unnamed protein product [Amoebophrya sp. A120]|eukprot:GSA120T00006183001.1